ncbi:hypothetical protein DNTS_021319 [Danionella cerebrum]|uniref:Calponin-homology (CH) domain-containing protein n=1 Tax=Danionella cerebrum TaxID=2873325 RepID=A0A553MNZ5_9TELE|nr:hypothetical protein DNTS_021319 [Danionella translucida]
MSRWIPWRRRSFFRRQRKKFGVPLLGRNTQGIAHMPGVSLMDTHSDYEHDAVQKKTFTKWINAQFSKKGKGPIKDMFSDLRDGRKLLDLLEELTGSILTKERGSTRVHSLNNVNRVLQVLHQNSVELVNIGGTDIVDGNHKLTLGLIWSIILHWQVKDVMKDVMLSLQQTNSEKILLSWVRNCTRNYSDVNVLNFTTSWVDGLAFNAILHHFRPLSSSWEEVLHLTPVERLDRAFTFAKDQLNIERLLDPEGAKSDVAVQLPDKKSIIMYVTSLFAVFPNDITMEDIREVETLPRRYRAEHEEGPVVPLVEQTLEEAGRSGTLAEMNPDRYQVTLDEVNLESYQVTLEEVLTWLLSAEDTLHMQEEVSGQVEEVKDQFHTHESFMLELTAQQSGVGSVLQAGHQLMAQGQLSEEEEEEIQQQMSLLNSRWESLRLASMDRQARLHEVLMDLQQQQLQQLSDWLTQTEGRIRKMETEPIAGDVQGFLNQIEKHKMLQNDLEAEQVKVNSLTHMVVVVDENSGEGATAALEEQLQSLGERWAAVCRWTEERWNKLDQIQLIWQRLLDDQGLFGSWLSEKEKALAKVQTCEFRDASEINASVRRLASLKEEMAQKRRTLSALSDAGQNVTELLKSPAAAESIERDTDRLTQRWDNLVQTLEDCSGQVTDALSITGITPVQETVVMETVTTVMKEETVVRGDRELAPPTSPKRRHLDVDTEIRRLVQADVPELLSHLDAWRASAKAAGDSSVLLETLQALEVEFSENEGSVKEMIQRGEKMTGELEKEDPSSVETVSCLGSLREAWASCEHLIEELRFRAGLQDQLQALVHVLQEQESWIKNTLGFSSEQNQHQLQVLRDESQARLGALEKLKLQLEDLRSKAESLTSHDALMSSMVALTTRHSAAHQELQSLQDNITAVVSRLAGSRALQQLESRLLSITGDITDMAAVEKALAQTQTLSAEVEQQCLKATDPAEQQSWTELSTSVHDQLSMLQCVLGSMRDSKVKIEEVERWLSSVEELLSRDSAGFNNTDALQDELNHCKELVGEMESMDSSLKQVIEDVTAVQQSTVPGLSNWIRRELEECQERWDTLSKELLRREERVSEGQEKVVNLKKDVAEMREWMLQVDEEFLMRDFEYKSPEELEEALLEMKRAKEDVLQKEVRVKILKDSINVLISQTPPELSQILTNYQKLCERFRSKCHTLEEVWSCWIELNQYLDAECVWLNTLEEKLQASCSVPENTQAIIETQETLECVVRHPGDNKTQIRELAQTLIDGGILDELISEKLERFNSRYEELTRQAGERQAALERQLSTLRENEAVLHSLQSSFSQLDQTLTSYLTDRIDAFQLPQEAQAIQAEIAAHESLLEDLRKRNVGTVPLSVPEGKTVRGGTMLEQLQRKLREITTKFQLFQKPANFEQRMLDCKRILENAKAELHVLELKDTRPEEIQSHLSGCMKLYKILSEVKLEVETVIKTGRQIVQKQQTENPKGMDEQLTALKLLYNDLGAQVTEGKQDLEKALTLSQQLQKESAALQAWMSQTETLLRDKISREDMPADIEAEITWVNGLLQESERRKADLTLLMEQSTALHTLVEGSEAQLEDQLFQLSEDLERSHTLVEDWLSAVLAVLCELQEMRVRVDGARDQAMILMSSRGSTCRELLEPKLEHLNSTFNKVAQHISSAQVNQELVDGRSAGLLLSSSQTQRLQSDLEEAFPLLEKTPPHEDEMELHAARSQSVAEVTLKAPSTSPHQRSGVSLSLQQDPLSPSELLLDINKLLLTLADCELLLNSSELTGGLFQDFSGQEDTLRQSLDCLVERVQLVNERQPELMLEVSGQEMGQMSEALAQLNSEWHRLNHMYSQRKGNFDDALEQWKHFHGVLSDLSQWMSNAELLLSEQKTHRNLNQEQATSLLQALEQGLASRQRVLLDLSGSADHISAQVSSAEAAMLKEKMESLTQRWTMLQRGVTEQQRRLLCEDSTVMEVFERSAGLAHWLDLTEGTVGSLSATDNSLADLKALTEQIEGQNETLSWLNKTGTLILSNCSLTPQDREARLNEIRQINIRWSKVSGELLDKLREVEGRLQTPTHKPLQDEGAVYGLFQQRMHRLGDWVQLHSQTLTDITSSQRQVLEMSMLEQKRELEDLLSHSIELQRKQLLLPQEKNQIEKLAADWKALDLQMKETMVQPLSPWTRQVSQLQFTSEYLERSL